MRNRFFFKKFFKYFKKANFAVNNHFIKIDQKGYLPYLGQKRKFSALTVSKRFLKHPNIALHYETFNNGRQESFLGIKETDYKKLNYFFKKQGYAKNCFIGNTMAVDQKIKQKHAVLKQAILHSIKDDTRRLAKGADPIRDKNQASLIKICKST